LIWAAQNGHVNIVSLLLRHGIHPDTPDSSGNTAAHYAAGYGWSNVLKFLVDNGAHPDLKNDWNSTPAMIAMLKNHFGCLDYLMGLKEVDKSMVDNEGRSVISQLCMGFNKDTINQIKYMDKFKSIDYTLKDGNGWTCMHFLASNQMQDHIITQRVNQMLVEEKAQLEKKLGRTLNAQNQSSLPKFAAKKRSAKMMRYGMAGAMPAKRATPAMPFGFTLMTDNGGDDQEDEDNTQTFSVYYDANNLKHRKYYKQVREEYEDLLIECAKHLVSKGIKEDSFTFNGLSALRIAIDNSNTKLALWMIDNFSDISLDHFKIDETNPGSTVFLSDLSYFDNEVDWEPLIKIIIQKSSKETLHKLLSFKTNGNITLINYINSNPNSGYSQNSKIVAYLEEKYLKNLDLLLEMAKACGYDVGAQTSYNKSNAYNYPGITQEKLDKFFEAPNTKVLDQKVNQYGLIDLSLNENTHVYLEEG
jgi:ankyrin repeat protein